MGRNISFVVYDKESSYFFLLIYLLIKTFFGVYLIGFNIKRFNIEVFVFIFKIVDGYVV